MVTDDGSKMTKLSKQCKEKGNFGPECGFQEFDVSEGRCFDLPGNERHQKNWML